MGDINDKKYSNTTDDIQYTIVMRRDEVLPDEKPERSSETASDFKKSADRLYHEYEKICFRDPTVLDKDDIYPRSYQWRLGDRYDPGKLAAVKEAVLKMVRIEETEAYGKYAETMSGKNFTPDSWD